MSRLLAAKRRIIRLQAILLAQYQYTPRHDYMSGLQSTLEPRSLPDNERANPLDPVALRNHALARLLLAEQRVEFLNMLGVEPAIDFAAGIAYSLGLISQKEYEDLGAYAPEQNPAGVIVSDSPDAVAAN